MGTDYTACSGEGCPIKDKCYRFFGPKEPSWQSYFADVPGKWIDTDVICSNGSVIDVNVKRWDCEMFWGERNESILNQLKEIMK